MRRLNPLVLAQLPAPPAAPPAGHVSLYPGPDGSLYRQTPDGVAVPLPTWQTARLTADHLAPPGTQPMIPGLTADVQPGLHELRANLWLNAYDAGRVLMVVNLNGPAASLLSASTQLTYPGMDFYAHTADQYGSLTGATRYWVYQEGEGLILMRLDAIVDVTEAGTIGFTPSVERNRLAFGSSWATDNADATLVDTPVHSEPDAVLLTARGDADHAAVWSGEYFSSGPFAFSAWLMSPTGWSDAGVRVVWLDADNDVVGVNELIQVIPAGAWTEYVIQDSAPAGATGVEVNVGLWNTPAEGAELYVDDVVLEQTTGQLQVGAGSLLAVTRM